MSRRRVLMRSLGLLACLAICGPLQAQDAARCVEAKGALLAGGGESWKAVKAGDAVKADASLVSLFEARLESANKAVGIKLIADIGEFGPLPVLESAIRIHESAKADATVSLERGIVAFTNLKSEGPAKVVVRMLGVELEVNLTTPGTKLGVELYGRHPGGAVHALKDEPTSFVYVLISDGSAVIHSPTQTYNLSAPPGPAFLKWDSGARKAEIVTLEKFPPEFKRNDQEKQQLDKMCAAAEKLAAGDARQAAVGLLKSDDALARRVGVTAVGALDDVADLLSALGDAKHRDVRDQAILVLRSWMGRAPGQLKALRQEMIKQKYPLPQIGTTMQLLRGFDESERGRPIVLDLLVSLLESSHVEVRELAHWHLVRMAPKGREIPFDAGAAEATRQQAVERWRQVISAAGAPPAKN